MLTLQVFVLKYVSKKNGPTKILEILKKQDNDGMGEIYKKYNKNMKKNFSPMENLGWFEFWPINSHKIMLVFKNQQ